MNPLFQRFLHRDSRSDDPVPADPEPPGCRRGFWLTLLALAALFGLLFWALRL